MEKRIEFEENEYRLILGIGNYLKMQNGNVAALCGHAALSAYTKALANMPKTLKNWLKYGGTKITMKTTSEKIKFG